MIFPDLSVAENIFIGHRDRGKIVDRRRMEREATRGPGAARRAARRRRAGARSDPGRAADRRDRQGDLARRARAHHGRADRLALGARGAAALSHRQHAAPAGRGDSLHLPPHGRGLRDRRSGHDPARRPLDFDDASQRADAGHGDPPHGRPRGQGALSPRAARNRARSASPCAISAAKGVFEDVSFDVRAGEVLGFAGLVGARRTDVGLALFGIAPADRGEIALDGAAVTVTNPRDAMALRHRLQHRGPTTAGSRHAALDRRQHLAAVTAPLPLAPRPGAPRGGAR